MANRKLIQLSRRLKAAQSRFRSLEKRIDVINGKRASAKSRATQIVNILFSRKGQAAPLRRRKSLERRFIQANKEEQRLAKLETKIYEQLKPLEEKISVLKDNMRKVRQGKKLNPRYLITATRKRVEKDVDLGVLQDDTAVKALSRAKGIYKGKSFTNMKARKRNPDLDSAELDNLPHTQKTAAQNVAMRQRMSDPDLKRTDIRYHLNADKTVSVFIRGSEAARIDRKGKYMNARKRNPTPAQRRARKAFAKMAKERSRAAKARKRNPQASLKKAGQALKSAARGILATGSHVLSAGAKALNPTRRIKVRNSYIDLVIRGTAKKTPSGWKVGKKTVAQGRGTAKLSSGYYLDKATGAVYAKRQRNVAQGFYDSTGFHPIRASSDYDPGIAGETGGRSRTTRSSKRRASKKKAASTHKHKAVVKSRSATRSRLASRAISRRVPAKRRRNVEMGFYDATGFHPIRASSDYSEGQRPSRSKRAKSVKRKAASSAKTKRTVASRKTTTSRLAGRSLKKSSGLLKRRRNASAESIRKNFAGSVSGERDLFYPIGTPNEKLAKLGKLVSIKTEKGTIKPIAGDAWLVADSRGKLHIGTTTNKPLIDGPKRCFGKVSQVEYQDVKKHLGIGKQTIFWHRVGEENGIKPTLHADGKGGLVFKGGDYRLTSRGLEN